MSFVENLQKALNEGLEASKVLLGKAGDKARELGEKGVLRWEISQLNNQAEKISAKIGALVYQDLMVDKKTSVTKKGEVDVLLLELEGVKEKIETKEEKLKNL